VSVAFLLLAVPGRQLQLPTCAWTLLAAYAATSTSIDQLTRYVIAARMFLSSLNRTGRPRREVDHLVLLNSFRLSKKVKTGKISRGKSKYFSIIEEENNQDQKCTMQKLGKP
jgi:hypothetical protein